MRVLLMEHSNLAVCAHAIRTCWQSYHNSDQGGEKDLALINRVGNKFKHQSVLEHLCICVNINDDTIAQVFKENNFSTVTGVSGNWVISTNVRALQEIDLPIGIKHKLIPKDYIYLF